MHFSFAIPNGKKMISNSMISHLRNITENILFTSKGQYHILLSWAISNSLFSSYIISHIDLNCIKYIRIHSKNNETAFKWRIYSLHLAKNDE